jgi:hypothetical protein
MPLPGSKRDKAIKAQFLQEIVEPEVQVEEKAEELQEIVTKPVKVPRKRPQPQNALLNEKPLADHQVSDDNRPANKEKKKKRGLLSRIFKSGGDF